MRDPQANRRGTARRASDQAHRDPDRYDQLVELAPDGILVHDAGRITFANLAALRLAGAAERSQVVGQPIDLFLDPPYLKAVEAQLASSLDGTTVTLPIRDRLRRLDGGVLDVEVTALVFMDGPRAAVHLIVRDIGERLLMERAAKRAEEHLHQAQRMEAVGALAGGVAHEVNNMLTVILGHGDFLLRGNAPPATQIADVREIVKAAERAAVTTRQVLAFSRRAFHQPRTVELDAFVSQLNPLMRDLLGAEPELNVVCQSGTRIWVDPGQLEQVLLNVVLNARDAMKGNGTLTVATAETGLAAGDSTAFGVPIPPGRYAVLTVRDTGTGMDRQTLSRVFEPFFTTKPVGSGSSGLGLAAAYGLVKQNHGYVTATSEIGKGSEFSIFFPVLPEEGKLEIPRAPYPTLPRAHRGTILLVEAEAAVRTIATRSLESAGFRVVQAPDGLRALATVEEQGPPDLVLTDIMMVGMRGTELARELKRRWPAVPVVFISGYTLEDLRREGESDLAAEIIPKPFSPRALVETVARTLGRGRISEEGGQTQH